MRYRETARLFFLPILGRKFVNGLVPLFPQPARLLTDRLFVSQLMGLAYDSAAAQIVVSIVVELAVFALILRYSPFVDAFKQRVEQVCRCLLLALW